MATLDTIKEHAELVKNASVVGENTADRVGGVLTDIVAYIGGIDDNNEEIKQLIASEAEERSSADKALEQKVSDEAKARQEADASLSDSLLGLLDGTAAGATARKYPFVKIPDFAEDAPSGDARHDFVVQQLNGWLDQIDFATPNDDTKDRLRYYGRCRLGIDGMNAEVYNVVIGYENNDGLQYTLGSIAKYNDKEVTWNSNFHICYRVKTKGEWGAWTSISTDANGVFALKSVVSKLQTALSTETEERQNNYYTKSQIDTLIDGAGGTGGGDASAMTADDVDVVFNSVMGETSTASEDEVTE